MVNSPGAERDQETEDFARKIIQHAALNNISISLAIDEIRRKIRILKRLALAKA